MFTYIQGNLGSELQLYQYYKWHHYKLHIAKVDHSNNNYGKKNTNIK